MSPRPFLTWLEVDRQLEKLNFALTSNGTLVNSKAQLERFVALTVLIAGAIAAWADVSPAEDNVPIGDDSWDNLNNQLLEFAEEYLVG